MRPFLPLRRLPIFALVALLAAGVPPVAGAQVAAPADRPCGALEIARGVSVGGFLSDRYVWSDSGCRPRSAALVRNDVQDPTGRWGGYLRQYVYDVDGVPRVANGAPGGYPGFGVLINHFGDGASASHRAPGTGYAVVLAGRHHAIHEFRWRLSVGGGPVDATVQWFFATGRDNPVFAVTFDSSPAGPDVVKADTRAPYGELQWDGGAGSVVDGVEWGDRYVFRTVSRPLSFQSRWEYTRPNTVPYDLEWTASPDAEMGLVQSQTWQQHDAGGYRAFGLWGKMSEAPDLRRELLDPSGTMPAVWNWTYQLNQYQLGAPTPNPASRRLAWGANYGAVGQTRYNAYGDDRILSGYPYQSYSVFVVLGKHSATPVATEVAEVEAVQKTRLTARTGAVMTSGLAGIARADVAAYEPPGYNHVYGTWEVVADHNTADVDLAVSEGALRNPILVVHNFTAPAPPATIAVNDGPLGADVSYFASLDPASQTLWLTLAGVFTGSTAIHISADR